MGSAGSEISGHTPSLASSLAPRISTGHPPLCALFVGSGVSSLLVFSMSELVLSSHVAVRVSPGREGGALWRSAFRNRGLENWLSASSNRTMTGNLGGLQLRGNVFSTHARPLHSCGLQGAQSLPFMKLWWSVAPSSEQSTYCQHRSPPQHTSVRRSPGALQPWPRRHPLPRGCGFDSSSGRVCFSHSDVCPFL